MMPGADTVMLHVAEDPDKAWARARAALPARGDHLRVVADARHHVGRALARDHTRRAARRGHLPGALARRGRRPHPRRGRRPRSSTCTRSSAACRSTRAGSACSSTSTRCCRASADPARRRSRRSPSRRSRRRRPRSRSRRRGRPPSRRRPNAGSTDITRPAHIAASCAAALRRRRSRRRPRRRGFRYAFTVTRCTRRASTGTPGLAHAVAPRATPAARARTRRGGTSSRRRRRSWPRGRAARRDLPTFSDRRDRAASARNIAPPNGRRVAVGLEPLAPRRRRRAPDRARRPPPSRSRSRSSSSASVAVSGMRAHPGDPPGLAPRVADRPGGFVGRRAARAPATAHVAGIPSDGYAAGPGSGSGAGSRLGAGAVTRPTRGWNFGCGVERARWRRRFPIVPAMVCGDRTVTWGEFDDRAGRLASWLLRPGCPPRRPGRASTSPTSPEYLETFFAALKIGAAPLNVNYRYVADEVRYVLDNSGAPALVHAPEFADGA